MPHRRHRASGGKATRQALFHLARPNGHDPCRRPRVALLRLQGARPGHLAAWPLSFRRAPRDLPQHGSTARWPGPAVCRVLSPDPSTYGNPQNRGGGSNLASWTHDGEILFPRRLPGAKVPWEFQPQRPDTDHFNRDFKPELARGGAEICRLNPRTGATTLLSHRKPPVWDFRASESPDGRFIVFCRAETGGARGIWVMDADGRNPRLLTRGLEDKGADHPRWLPFSLKSQPG